VLVDVEAASAALDRAVAALSGVHIVFNNAGVAVGGPVGR
jgi:NAD(P)-dependent dehydrogenase (short-subunit alcohol dehydrogenase family)